MIFLFQLLDSAKRAGGSRLNAKVATDDHQYKKNAGGSMHRQARFSVKRKAEEEDLEDAARYVSFWAGHV
jgi:hypothetical protein